ncbi:MAG: hypothetical protein ACYC65_03915, partial [Candidatus Limnocylindrales bacterium]
VLALADDAAGQAAYTGAAAASFAAGLGASAAVARIRRPTGAGAAATGLGRPVTDVRPMVAALLGIASVALVVPILLRSGLPFLAEDITGSRAQIVGLVVQPLRVALPALAVAWLLRARLTGIDDGTGDGRLAARRTTAIAVALVAAIAVFDLLLASRYFVAELAGALAIGWLLGGGRVRWRVAAAAIAIGAVLFGGVQILRAYDQAQGQELAFAVERTVNRVLLVQPRTLDAIMTAIPADEPFFGGLGWLRRLGPVFGREVPNLGYWIYPRVVGDAQAVAGYAAPGLIGEAWANFGWAGLALFAALGAVAERLAALIARRPGQADRVAAALLVLFMARTHALGLGGLAVLVVLIVGWRIVAASADGLGGSLRAVLAWRSPAR